MTSRKCQYNIYHKAFIDVNDVVLFIYIIYLSLSGSESGRKSNSVGRSLPRAAKNWGDKVFYASTNTVWEYSHQGCVL